MVHSRVNTAGPKIMPGRTLAEVERDVAWLIDELTPLRDERDALPAQIEQAHEAQEPWRVEELERRRRELGQQLDVA